MGYLGYFYVETKAFEFRSNVQGGVQLEEKSKGRTRAVIMAWPTILWLVSAWDYLTNNETAGENWRTFRFGCYSYIMQRRKNSYGNYLELSEYGGKGRRSYVVIPEGYEGKGWKDGRLQLQRLKLHHEKQKEKVSLVEEPEGKKGGQSSGGTQEIKKLETNAQRSYAETVKGDQGPINALASQVAGEVAANSIKEGAHFMAENLAGQNRERMENKESIKQFLLSLQKQISSCLRRLELGWGEEEKENAREQAAEGNGPKVGTSSAVKEAGLGLVQPNQMVEPIDKPTREYIIKRYHKIYVRRSPPKRQVRWRPKVLGRKVQPEMPEGRRSWPSEGVGGGPATEDTDKSGGQSRRLENEAHTPVDKTIGGPEGVEAGGHAGDDADSDDEGRTGRCGENGGMGQQGSQVTTYADAAGVEDGGKASCGRDVGDTESSGEVTDVADATGGQPRTQNCGLNKAGKETIAGMEVTGSGGMDGTETESAEEGESRLTRGEKGLGQPEEQTTPPRHCADDFLESKVAGTGEKGGRETDSAEEGEIKQTRGVDGVGQAVDQITLPLCYAGDVAGGIPGSESLGGGIEHYGEVVVFVENPVQQYDMETERETDKNIGEIVRADTEVEQGEPEMLEIQPLAVMGADKCQTDAWDGVLEKILAFCQKMGSECDGHEEKLMALFTAIEANRNNRKGGNATKKGDKGGNRSNRELKRLENTVNYDVKGSAIVSGKGRNGKFC
jgi:hypothetical protein